MATAPLFLATGNPHKVEEVLAILRLAGLTIPLRPAGDLGTLPDVAETAGTYEGNARLKAEAVRPLLPSGALVFADDSGLEVDALDGAPGVHSARYAGPGADAADNNARLLDALSGVSPADRTARFRCCCFLLGDGVEAAFFGRCEGRILEGPRGEGGFGYDPLFQPHGHAETFAQMPASAKHAISHRGRAVVAMARYVTFALAH